MKIEQDNLVSFETGTLLFKGKTSVPVQPYDGKYVYMSDYIHAHKKEDLDTLISSARKIVEEGLDMTYVVIADQGPSLFIDTGRQICPTSTFSYSSNKVVFSMAKINGQIEENFISSPQQELEEYMYSHLFAPIR